LRLPPPAARRLLALLFLLSARAQADDVAAARRSFGEGVERFGRGDFEAYFFANQKSDNPLVYVPLGFGVRFF
jgi:hypothetical protein